MNILRLSWYRNAIILAILLRLLLMPFFFHPDVKTSYFQSQFLRNGVLNIYTYLDEQKNNLPIKEEFVYFPLTYFFLGSYQFLVSPFLGENFITWVSDASGKAIEATESFRYLFLLKLPYLFFDLAIAFLLIRFFNTEEQKRKAIIVWLFNPFTIILIYVFSNIDIITVFLTLFSLLLARDKKIILSALILGIGATFKAYTLIFLPFLLLYSKNLKQSVWGTFAALGVFTAVIAPFYSESFQKAALVSGLTTRIVFPGLSIGFGETLMAGIISISALLFFKIFSEGKDLDHLWKDYLSVLLLILSFIHFHIQWLLWAIPLLVILVIYNKRLTIPVLILGAFAFIIPLLYEDKFMSVSLYQNFSLLFSLVPIPYAFVSKIYDPYIVQSVLHSALTGGSLVLVWKMQGGKL